jgi:anti-anti-sigma factor
MSMSRRPRCVEVERVEDGVLLKVPAEHRIDSPLLRLAADCGRGTVYLDCAAVSAVNCLELGALVTAHKRLRGQGRRLVLGNVSPLVYEVFQLTKLSTLFEVRREALPCQPHLGASFSSHIPCPALVV